MSGVETIKQPQEHEHAPCVFCEMRKGNAELSKIKESEKSFAIIALEGHALVIPNEHITEDNLERHIDDVGDAYKLAVSLIPAVKEALGATGINLTTNLGKSAGQEISHFHIHLIDRTQGDNKMGYNLSQALSREELDNRAEKIKSKLNA